MNQLVSTGWLNKNLEKVKVLDASWHLPNVERNALEEYKLNHITNSFFLSNFPLAIDVLDLEFPLSSV